MRTVRLQIEGLKPSLMDLLANIFGSACYTLIKYP